MVRFKVRRLEVDRSEQRPCWYAMFNNPVIADSYPVPVRYTDEPGLEMSFEMMLVLAQTFSSVCCQGRFLLKGFNSILSPTSRKSDSVLSHFLVNKYGNALNYDKGIAFSKMSSMQEVVFSGSRHFVGWTDSVTFAPCEYLKQVQLPSLTARLCSVPIMACAGDRIQ